MSASADYTVKLGSVPAAFADDLDRGEARATLARRADCRTTTRRRAPPSPRGPERHDVASRPRPAAWPANATRGQAIPGPPPPSARALFAFQQLVTVYTNGVVVVSDMNTEQPVIRQTGHAPCSRLLPGREERRLITGSHGGTVHVHNFNNASLLQVRRAWPRSRSWSRCRYPPVLLGRRVVLGQEAVPVAGQEQNQAGVDVMELSAHKTDVHARCSTRSFASASADVMLRIWFAPVDFNLRAAEVYTWRSAWGSRGRPSVTRLLHLLQQNKLLSIQDGDALCPGKGRPPKTCVASAGDGVAAVALAPSGSDEEQSTVVTGDYRGRVIFWAVSGAGDRTTLTQRAAWEHPSGAAISSIAFSRPPAEGDIDVDPRVICGDVEGTTALLRLDGSFDHFFGSLGSPEPVEVGVEIAVTEASVRPAEELRRTDRLAQAPLWLTRRRMKARTAARQEEEAEDGEGSTTAAAGSSAT